MRTNSTCKNNQMQTKAADKNIVTLEKFKEKAIKEMVNALTSEQGFKVIKELSKR